MSLGENLQFLRKKNDITQEQLAEKLDISRQSVSKWESDTTYPEMDKLLLLCQMFHVSMDDLVQKDISTLYVEDKANYNKQIDLFSKMISLGVGLILLGISIMFFMEGMNIGKSFSKELCTMVFFIFLIIAVAIFIVMGLQHSDFERRNPYIENFYSEKEINSFHKKFAVMITTGVVLILIDVTLMIGLDTILSETFNTGSIDYEGIISSIFMFFIAIAVMILVYAGIQKGKYDIKEYNESHDTKSETYKLNQLKGSINGCIMMAAVIIYLILGFVWNEWGMPSVVVFPVFAIGCGITSVIIEAKYKKSSPNSDD